MASVHWQLCRQCGSPCFFDCQGPADAAKMIGPQLFLSREAPLYFTGLRACLSLYSALCFLVILQGFYLMYLNKSQERRRIALGLPDKLRDISIMSIEEAEVYKAELSEQLAARGETEGDLFRNAFDDMTDKENPMFMRVAFSVVWKIANIP